MNTIMRDGIAWSLVLVTSAFLGVGCSQQAVTPGEYQAAGKGLDSDFARQTDQPPSPRTLTSLAGMLAAQNKDLESKFVLNRLIKMYPKYAPGYAKLAELQLRHDDTDAALKTLKAGLAEVPAQPVLINNMGMCWLLKAEYEKAAEQFEYASMLDADNGRYMANLATARGMNGDYDGCLQAYQLVVPADDAHYNLAVICEARGDDARASDEYRRARELRLQRRDR